VRDTFARRAMSSMVRRSNWDTRASSRQGVDDGDIRAGWYYGEAALKTC
jgi:hypothetical protein